MKQQQVHFNGLPLQSFPGAPDFSDSAKGRKKCLPDRTAPVRKALL
jgi:hypothetical protein